MAMTLYNPKCPLKYQASEDVYVFISNITTRTVQVHLKKSVLILIR